MCAAHADKRRRLETEKHNDSDAFSEVECEHQTPVADFTMHAITSVLHML